MVESNFEDFGIFQELKGRPRCDVTQASCSTDRGANLPFRILSFLKLNLNKSKSHLHKNTIGPVTSVHLSVERCV